MLKWTKLNSHLPDEMNDDTSYLKFNYKSVRHFGHVEVRDVHAIDIESKPRTEFTQKQIAFYDRLHNCN